MGRQGLRSGGRGYLLLARFWQALLRYSSKMPITTCDLRVLPFYDALGILVRAILTDNGREFCGKPGSPPYELLLAIEDIEHRHRDAAESRVRDNRRAVDRHWRSATTEGRNRTRKHLDCNDAQESECRGIPGFVQRYQPAAETGVSSLNRYNSRLSKRIPSLHRFDSINPPCAARTALPTN